MSKDKKKILVVDDDTNILELLQYNLTKERYIVKTASEGIKAVEIAKKFMPDMIILDVMMPKQDGIETCRQIRLIPNMKNIFVIFLTARSEEYSEVAAFEMGADDYISKPIKPRALVSRIQALFRRQAGKQKKEINIIQINGLLIDRTAYTIQLGEELTNLPKKEFELLFFLAMSPGVIFNREDLLKNIWGSDVFVLARTVDVHIRRIRKKIGNQHIKTIKGVGYKFEKDNN